MNHQVGETTANSMTLRDQALADSGIPLSTQGAQEVGGSRSVRKKCIGRKIGRTKQRCGATLVLFGLPHLNFSDECPKKTWLLDVIGVLCTNLAI